MIFATVALVQDEARPRTGLTRLKVSESKHTVTYTRTGNIYKKCKKKKGSWWLSKGERRLRFNKFDWLSIPRVYLCLSQSVSDWLNTKWTHLNDQLKCSLQMKYFTALLKVFLIG